MASPLPVGLKNAKAATVTGIVEADETFIRKSAKGSKRLIGRALRKRGGKAKQGLSTEEHDCVLIVRDRGGATTDQVLSDLQARTFAAYLTPVAASLVGSPECKITIPTPRRSASQS